MNKKQMLVLSAVAAGLVGMGTANLAIAKDAKVNCMGVNSCKGKGACKGDGHDCGGKNECKGKGMMKMSKKACEKKHGTVMDDAAPHADAPKEG